METPKEATSPQWIDGWRSLPSEMLATSDVEHSPSLRWKSEKRGWIIDPPEFICIDVWHVFGSIFGKMVHFFRKMVHPTFYQSELIVHEIILKTPLALLRRWPCAMLTGPSNGRTFPLCSHDIGNSLPQALRGIYQQRTGWLDLNLLLTCDVERGSGCLKTPHSANGPWKKKVWTLFSLLNM